MKKNFLKVIKSTAAIAAVAILAVSCTKDNSTKLQSSSADSKLSVSAVPSSNTYTITGRWGNPASGPAVFGTVYVNLATGAQDTTSNTVGANVLFTSTNNSVVKVPTGYSLKYLYNTSATFSALKISDFTAAAVASVGQNTGGTTPNGWYNYVVPGGVTPISGFYLLVTNTTTNVNYVIQFTGAVGQGTATNNRGVYTIKTGIINNL
ncbi:hypothetical protein SAMN05421821_101135 [Mucilaginibacter lappiensis]|uniref:Uncharacterized protein n=1 Tax=Mucilaginibacter lappiensis TaxID=354630 RepID=A0ABR6PDV6_9SPHI|nr:hypothetical protein [Mucilaginibacter lappiensis]MBB6107950.1 hypothetical protein [Mucilaginibacter lappiensis]SIP91468.1 hypothetical protein SAMN05421821_101135 [Mucilaginibacter lappiensis]